jgi:hypothetical protein
MKRQRSRRPLWKHHPRLLRLWQRLSLWSVCIDAPKVEVTWFSGDDVHERTRVYKFDREIRFPRLAFRPYCWLFGHDDDSYGSCVICEKRLYDYRTGRKLA